MPATHEHGKHDHDDELHAKSEAGKNCRKLGNSLKHCPSLSVAAWLLTVQICTNTKYIASSKSQMLINGGKCRAVQG